MKKDDSKKDIPPPSVEELRQRSDRRYWEEMGIRARLGDAIYGAIEAYPGREDFVMEMLEGHRSRLLYEREEKKEHERANQRGNGAGE